MNRGILLNEGNDIKISGGTLAVGDSKVQDAYVALVLGQGDLKEHPLVGVNLKRMIRGKVSREAMRKTIEQGLLRVGIRFDELRDQLAATVNNETLKL